MEGWVGLRAPVGRIWCCTCLNPPLCLQFISGSQCIVMENGDGMLFVVDVHNSGDDHKRNVGQDVAAWSTQGCKSFLYVHYIYVNQWIIQSKCSCHVITVFRMTSHSVILWRFLWASMVSNYFIQNVTYSRWVLEYSLSILTEFLSAKLRGPHSPNSMGQWDWL